MDAHDQFFADAQGQTEPEAAHRQSLETHILKVTDIEHITHAFVALDRQWRVVYISQQAAQLLQKTREELLGKQFWEAFPAFVDSPLYQHCLQAASSGTPARFVVESLHHRKWLHLHFYPSSDEIAIFLTDIIEQRQADAQLRFQATILRHISDCVIVTDLQGNITYWNEGANVVFGYTAQEILGKTPALLYPEWERRQANQDLKQLLAGTDFVGEWQGRRKDGTEVWVDVKTTILRDTQGKDIGLIGIAKDITERKQAKALLNQSEKRFRALIENNPAGIALTDANGIITFVSPSTMHLVGFLPEEFVGHRIFERTVYAADREITSRLWVRVFEEPGKSQAAEYRTRRKDGTFLWIEVIGINLLHEPCIEAIVWNYRDVTERKRLTEEIAKAKEQLAVILKNVDDGILVQDANGHIIYANDAAAIMAGYPSAEDLLEAPLLAYLERFDMVDEQGQPFPVSRLPGRRAIQGEATLQETVRFINKQSQEARWLLIKSTSMVEYGQMSALVLSVLQDITQFKELEQRKNHFISIASHELRTPVTSISGFAEILQMLVYHGQGLESPQGLRAISTIFEQSQRLSRLIGEMLDLSRIEQVQLFLTSAPTDLLATLVQVIESQRITTKRHSIRLTLEGLDTTDTLIGHCDADRIEQIFHNLISNAIKYSPAGGEIEVGLRATPGVSHEALIWVKDHGIGIPPGELPHIFERFHRADNLDLSISGMGIGLYLVKELVTRHGGRVWVESTVRVGSTFFVALPLI